MTAAEYLESYRTRFPKGLLGLYHERPIRILGVTRQRHTDMPTVMWEAQDSSATGWCQADHFEKHFTPDK